MTPVDLGLTGKRASSRLINYSRASSDEEQMIISSMYIPKDNFFLLVVELERTLRNILGSLVNFVNPMAYLESVSKNPCRYSDHA